MFRDKTGMFTPVTDQFSGLGQGIGSGVNQFAKNRLYDKMREKYLNAQQQRVQAQALSDLAKLQGKNTIEAPIEGDPNYPIFQQLIDSKMAQAQARADIGRGAMAIDEAKGLDYMLAEEAQAKSGTKGKEEAEQLRNTPAGKMAEANYIQAWNEYNQAAMNLVSDPLNPKNLQADVDARNKFIKAELDFINTVGLKPSEMGLRSGSQIEKAREVTGQIKDQGITTAKKINDEIRTAYKMVREDTNLKNMPVVDKTVAKGQLTLEAYRDIERMIKEFPQTATEPGVMFAAVKRLAQFIEPGLQVTTDEVKGFKGSGQLADALNALARVVASIKSLKVDDGTAKGDKAGKEATRENPARFWPILIQANNTAADALLSYQNLFQEAVAKAKQVAEPSLNAFVRNNTVIPEKDKGEVETNALAQIGFSIPPSLLTAKIEKIDPNTPMPALQGETPPDEKTPDLADAKLAETDAKRAAGAGPDVTGTQTGNPIQNQINAEGAKIAEKATSDLIRQQLEALKKAEQKKKGQP